MPDEAIYAERALALWRNGALPLLHGAGAGYGVVYPAVAAFPLSQGGFAHGHALLKAVQAVVMSLSALPVYLYGRRLMAPRYALLAATITVASPLLLYSGLVMTEVVFYPVAALALLACARAIASATLRNQAVALLLIGLSVLTRTQAVVFVGVLAGGILVEAVLSHDLRRIRSFWPTWVTLACVAVIAAAVPGVFGSYAGTLRGSYPIGDALGLTFDHLALIALSTGIVPLAALVLLLVDSFRVRDPNSDVRALLAVTTCAVVLVSVQVGFFSARYAQHLLGRDLAALPPLLALVFALWLASDSRRHIVAATASAFLVLAVLLLTPWNHLVGANAFPDTFAIALLDDLHGRNPADVVTVVSVLVLAAFVLLPRRARLLLAVFVVAGLVVNSVLASNKIRTLANADQTGLVGSPPDWIDRAAKGPVTYLYDGEAYWNGVWQERVWNRRLTSVLSIQPYRVPGPVGQTIFAIPTSGVLPMKNRYVVASDIHTFVGEPVAHLTQTGLDVTGLTLWHLDMPPRLAVVKRGFQPNGDMTAPATVDVYGCTRGQLELTLLPKATSVLRITLNGRQVVEQHVAGQPVWHGSVPVPSTSKPRLCEFTIYGQSLLGSTRIDWVPG